MVEFSKEGLEALAKKTESKLLATKGDPDYDANAISILKMRYLKRAETGEYLEDAKGLASRVASNIAAAEYRFGKMKKKLMKLLVSFMML